jgi:hypothetical protein
MRLTIHHFDDEPENISSLRDNLFHILLSIEPDWVSLSECIISDDDTAPYTFTVTPPNQDAIEITYRIYADSESFCEDASLNANDIVLLDAIERGPAGEPNEGVRRCICKAVEAGIDPSRFFLMSAFVDGLPADIKESFLSECIIKKPFNLNNVAKGILRLCGVDLKLS